MEKGRERESERESERERERVRERDNGGGARISLVEIRLLAVVLS